MDLTVLTRVDSLDVKTYVRELVRRFRDEVTGRLEALE
jgi:hypothetical protein